MLTLNKTNVNIGSEVIEGLTDGNGNFYVSVAQLYKQFQFSSIQNYASRDLKRMLGASFHVSKVRIQGTNNENSAIQLGEYQVVVRKLAESGNVAAQQFINLLFGLSLQQLFCDAFGIKFENEDRQAWLRHREEHRTGFHPRLTAWLKLDGMESGASYGRAINIFKHFAGVPIKPVNEYDAVELDKLNRQEAIYNALRKVGKTHIEAIKQL